MLQRLVRFPRLLLVAFVRGYQRFISPLLPPTCRYQPTCSQYAVEALQRYGVFKGLVLTVYRLSRCHPWGGHGYDPPRWFGEQEAGPEATSETPTESHPKR